ncbi:MAG: sterol desaturase family protein [Gammaproteobacteria bacterium]|nr:sterol desaturase family protein [Gammaproteobacteria bacterium]MDG1953200.1 sterol desaturase family protein [Gammaproteobacteria bacterium]
MIEFLSSPTTAQWLTMLSMFGWIWIIPLIERLRPLKRQAFFRKGMVNDVIHTYHRLHLHSIINIAFVTWMITYLRENGTQSLPYQGLLADAHWGWNMFALLLMGHLTFYAAHFLSHKIPFLWQFHRVHHSSVNLDSISTSRFHIVDKALFAAPYLILVAYFQPDPGLTFLYISFRDFWGRYSHGNISDAHWLGYFMSNPKFHRWHHSNHPEAIDKNFSAEFNFLDYMFGTAYYPKEGIPDTFGEPGYSNNIFMQHFRPFVEVFRLIQSKGIRSALWRDPVTKDPKTTSQAVNDGQ